MDDLKALRSEIDEIDDLVIKLLMNRFNISKKVGKYKLDNHIEVNDNNRELDILNKIDDMVKEEVLANSIKSIYQELFVLSKNLQK